MRRENKKGAVELSLNLIIMLIIGMVILGLVIAFVQNIVTKGTDVFEGEITKQDQLSIDDVSKCRNNFCVKPSPTINLKNGENKIFLKLRNTNTPITNCGPGIISEGIATDCKISIKVVSVDGASLPPVFKLIGPGHNLEAGEEKSDLYKLVLEGVPTGSYYVTLTFLTDYDVVLTAEVN